MTNRASTDHAASAAVRPAWPHDRRPELDAFYGHPGTHAVDPQWVLRSLVKVPVPWCMTYSGTPVSAIQIHTRCAASLRRILEALWAGHGRDQAAIAATGLHLYSGSFNFRPVRGAATLSCHAYGAAIDFDAAHHPLGSRARFPDGVVAAFKAEGWFYGGDFKTRPDGMHFQATNGA